MQLIVRNETGFATKDVKNEIYTGKTKQNLHMFEIILSMSNKFYHAQKDKFIIFCEVFNLITLDLKGIRDT